MGDARASRQFTIAARAGGSRAAAPTERPAVAHAVANAADVSDAPADAVIVGRPTKAAESVASSGARLMRMHDLFAGQANCSAAIASGAATAGGRGAADAIGWACSTTPTTAIADAHKAAIHFPRQPNPRKVWDQDSSPRSSLKLT